MTSLSELERDDGLFVIAIVADADAGRLMKGVFEARGDEFEWCRELADGLARATSESPDVVFVEVSLDSAAGVAAVHHIRAMVPKVAVYALAAPKHVELATQAVSLGGAGLLMLPLSGDELLTAVEAVRNALAERRARERLERQLATAQRASEATRRIGACLGKSRRQAAEDIAEVLKEVTGADPVLLYLPATGDSKQLVLQASVGETDLPPTFCAEMEMLNYARDHSFEVLPLVAYRERAGFAVLGFETGVETGNIEAAQHVGVQAALVLSLLGEREHSHSGAMKDPYSSAYTFAYFVDVAGREIDKARRHERRFALATIAVSDLVGPPSADGVPSERPNVEVAETILSTMRDTDVLARVDEGEFYLLLPETGGTGAHSARRRILRETGVTGDRRHESSGLDVTVGVATYPHDGADLSHLLRVAKHRADASRASCVPRLRLDRMPLVEIIDALLWTVGDDDEDERYGFFRPASIELPAPDVIGLAVGAVTEAMRGGSTRIYATAHGGLSIGTGVRAACAAGNNVEVELLDKSRVEECDDVEVLAVVAEHGAYALLGRVDRGVMRAVHCADPLFVDLIIERLGATFGQRLGD